MNLIKRLSEEKGWLVLSASSFVFGGLFYIIAAVFEPEMRYLCLLPFVFLGVILLFGPYLADWDARGRSGNSSGGGGCSSCGGGGCGGGG